MMHCWGILNPPDVFKRTLACLLSNSIFLRSRFIKAHIVFLLRSFISIHIYVLDSPHQKTDYARHKFTYNLSPSFIKVFFFCHEHLGGDVLFTFYVGTSHKFKNRSSVFSVTSLTSFSFSLHHHFSKPSYRESTIFSQPHLSLLFGFLYYYTQCPKMEVGMSRSSIYVVEWSEPPIPSGHL